MTASSKLQDRDTPLHLPLHKELSDGWVLVVYGSCGPTDPRDTEEFLTTIHAWSPRKDASMTWSVKSLSDLLGRRKSGDNLLPLYDDGHARLSVRPVGKHTRQVGLALSPSTFSKDPQTIERLVQSDLDSYEQYRLKTTHCIHMMRENNGTLQDDHNHPHSYSDLYPNELTPAILDDCAHELALMMHGQVKNPISPETIGKSEWKSGKPWNPDPRPSATRAKRTRYRCSLQIFGKNHRTEYILTNDILETARMAISAAGKAKEDEWTMVDVEDLRDGSRQRMSYSPRSRTLDLQPLTHPEIEGAEDVLSTFDTAMNQLSELALEILGEFDEKGSWREHSDPQTRTRSRQSLFHTAQKNLIQPIRSLQVFLNERDRAANAVAERTEQLIENSDIDIDVSMTPIEEDDERDSAISARIARADTPDKLASVIIRHIT